VRKQKLYNMELVMEITQTPQFYYCCYEDITRRCYPHGRTWVPPSLLPFPHCTVQSGSIDGGSKSEPAKAKTALGINHH